MAGVISHGLEYVGLVSNDHHSEFVNTVFSSRDEYEKYVDEFENGPAVSYRNEALEEFQKIIPEHSFGDVGVRTSRDYYAVTRKLKPEQIVETGVCNGVSTLAILLAIRENGHGVLHSIDYPFRADESLAEFQQDTFNGYGGAAIPSDKNPGWIIPEDLRSNWDLTIGKSQRELPKLITKLGGLDLFIHDSEHSHPCMMFEYELAYEWLDSGGMILSDDITWNDAFSVFTDVRRPRTGKISEGVGYIMKG